MTVLELSTYRIMIDHWSFALRYWVLSSWIKYIPDLFTSSIIRDFTSHGIKSIIKLTISFDKKSSQVLSSPFFTLLKFISSLCSALFLTHSLICFSVKASYCDRNNIRSKRFPCMAVKSLREYAASFLSPLYGYPSFPCNLITLIMEDISLYMNVFTSYQYQSIDLVMYIMITTP